MSIAAVTVLLVMIALAFANLIRVAGDSAPATIAATRIAVAPPVDSLTLEGAFATAQARAHQWSSGARLAHASLQVDWPLDSQSAGPAVFPPGGWARFAFADEARGQVVEIVVERYSGAILSEVVIDWPGTHGSTEPLGATAVSSRDAVLVAETAIGQTFRLACPVSRHRLDVSLRAAPMTTGPAEPISATPTSSEPAIGRLTGLGTPTTTAPGEPVWLISYRDDRYAGMNAVEIEVGAESGSVLALRDRTVPCG